MGAIVIPESEKWVQEICVGRVAAGAGIIAELLQELNRNGELFRVDQLKL